MHARFPALTALLALAAVHAVSGQTQKCAYSCQPIDNGGYKLGKQSDTDGVLSCSYPAFPDKSDDVNGFYCNYSDTDGTAKEGNDVTFCPATAASACGTAPAPAPTTKPAPPTKTPPTKAPSPARDLNEVKMMKKRLPVQGEDLS